MAGELDELGYLSNGMAVFASILVPRVVFPSCISCIFFLLDGPNMILNFPIRHDV